MKLHTNIRKFYLYNLFHSLVFAYVIERLFWASRGMSIMDVVLLEIVYGGIIVALELPTGMIADRFKRRTLIIIDSIFAFIEFAIIIFATEFWHFAIAIGISAIGHALQSGAFNALLYDSLKTSDSHSDMDKTLGRLKAIDYAGALVGGLTGAYIASRHPLVTTYHLSLISLFIAIIIAFSIREVSHEKTESSWSIHDWITIGKFIFHVKTIRYIAFVGIVTAAITTYIDEFWQLYLQAIQIDVSLFGVFEIFAFGAVSLGSILAYKLKENMGLHKTLILMVLMGISGLLFALNFRMFIGAISIPIVYFGMSVIEPIIYSYLHDHAIPKYRATIESAYSMLTSLSTMLLGIPFGILSTSYSIFAGFIYLAGLLILILLVMVTVYLVNRKFLSYET